MSMLTTPTFIIEALRLVTTAVLNHCYLEEMAYIAPAYPYSDLCHAH